MKCQIVRSQGRKGDFFRATGLPGTLSVPWGGFSAVKVSSPRLSRPLCRDVGCKNGCSEQSRRVSPAKVTPRSCLRSILACLYF